MGLKPGNPDGTYRAERAAGGIPGDEGHRGVPGGRQDDRPEFPDDFVGVPGRAGESSRSKDSEVVFVGYGVVAPEYGWDDYKGLDVRGKTLSCSSTIRPSPTRRILTKLDPDVFKGRAMTYYGRWTYKYEIAAKKGAAAALILVHETGPAGYPFAVVQGSLEPRELRHRRASRSTPSRPCSRGLDHAADGHGTLSARPGHDFDRLEGGRDRRPISSPVSLDARAGQPVDRRPPRGPVAQRGRPARRFRPGAARTNTSSSRPTGTISGATRSEGRPDLQRRGRQRLGHGRGAGDRPGLHQGQPGPETFDPLPVRDRRGEGTARREVLRGHPLYPLATTLADINLDVINFVGPTTRPDQHRHGPVHARRPACRARPGQRPHGRCPTPSRRRAIYFRSDHFEFAKQGVPALDPKGGVRYIGKPAGLRPAEAATSTPRKTTTRSATR